jgi:hypothetical protein
MAGLLQDLAYVLRQVRKSPGFTAIAVLTLALGTGANTAIFSFLEATLFLPAPYPHADELVTIGQRQVQTRGSSILARNLGTKRS